MQNLQARACHTIYDRSNEIMKENSLKLLLNVVPTSDQPKAIAVATLKRVVFPNLKSASFRSLLYLAKSRGWLDLQTVAGERVVIGTKQALTALQAQFPALLNVWATWQGDWLCLVFNQPPKTDKQFRYLRNWCQTHKCIQLSRGVYLAPDVYLSQFLNQLKPIYDNSIYILKTREWQADNIDRVAREKYSIIELSNQYSGVSNQIERLLKILDLQKKLDDGHIEQLQSLFERLFLAIAGDLGVIRYYFSYLKAPLALVGTWQSLVGHENLVGYEQSVSNEGR
ncbi:MAG: hypothetical protein ABIJ03_02500 [Patescibacteria group bacterium]